MTDPAVGDGSQDYDAALPGAPTELAPSADETSAHTAWALDDGPEWKPPFWTASRITAVAVTVAILAVVVVAGLVGYHLQPSQMTAEPPATSTTTAAAAATTSVTPKLTPPPVTVTTVVVQQPPKTVTRQAAPPPSWQGGPAPIDSAGLPPAPTVIPALIPFNDEFMATLERNGIAIYDRPLALKQAHATCSMLRDGEHPDLVSRKLMGVNPNINWQGATQVVGIVRDVYPGCFPS